MAVRFLALKEGSEQEMITQFKTMNIRTISKHQRERKRNF